MPAVSPSSRPHPFQKKPLSLKNVTDEPGKMINFIKCQHLSTHLFDIWCDALGSMHTGCLLPGVCLGHEGPCVMVELWAEQTAPFAEDQFYLKKWPPRGYADLKLVRHYLQNEQIEPITLRGKADGFCCQWPNFDVRKKIRILKTHMCWWAWQLPSTSETFLMSSIGDICKYDIVGMVPWNVSTLERSAQLGALIFPQRPTNDVTKLSMD